MKKNQNKLEETQLTLQEWLEALKVPAPHRNKKKFYRKNKHKNNGED
jgi:hypothetical protein